MPRILIVAEQLRRPAPGGIGTYVRGLVSGLMAVDRASPEPGDLARDMALYASRSPSGGDPLVEMGLPVVTSRLGRRALSQAWDHGWADVAGGVALVHATSLAAPPARRARLTVMVHDTAWRRHPEVYPARGRRWHEAALARVVGGADAFVVPSSAVADDLVEAGAAPRSVHVVEHGSDHLGPPDDPGAEALLHSLGVEGSFLMSVGTLEPRKNLARLVEAYQRARPKLEGRPGLVVVGPRGWGADGTTARPPEGVVLAGAVDGPVLAGLYRRASMLAYVPLAEGFGLPPVEAMAAGIPVVASDVPSLGGAALLVDPMDVGSMAAGIERVMGQPGLAEDLRVSGAARAAALTWAASARAHLAIWDELT